MKILITGTSAYGPRGEDSDIDIVLFANDSYKLESDLRRARINTYQTQSQMENEGYDGYIFRITADFPSINIIEVSDEKEFKCWEFATNEMKKLKPILSRLKRIEEFQKFFVQAKKEVFP